MTFFPISFHFNLHPLRDCFFRIEVDCVKAWSTFPNRSAEAFFRLISDRLKIQFGMRSNRAFIKDINVCR